MKKASAEKVRVVCRVRPTNQKEISNGGTQCVKLSEKAIDVTTEDGSHAFSFDRIFGSESTQSEVFEYTAIPLIQDTLQGYNATIFAYGQTGTGKTHTMEGNIHHAELKGIIPRSVEALFDGVLEADENIEFTFKVSYVEIYMEKIRDLLDENRLKNNLTVREDKIKGIYIAGVTEEYVTSHEELLDIMQAGALNRAVAATGMNEGSSRSHSVFTITVSQRDLTNNTSKSGKLVLVDLAGSEMVRKSNASGQQLEEAKTINKSLSALGQVINALTDEKQTHVPYRDSKLTRVLQDSLGGNSKTVLIVAVSPSSFNANETVSTLRFGTRAKSIENKVTVNETRSVEELEGLLVRAEKAIDTQMAHILALTTQLQALQSGGAADQPELSGARGAVGEEASALIEQLQQTVASLTQDLEEERAESARKDSEMQALTQLLKDKERLFQEAGELLLEVQRHYETQRERSEQLVREKAEAVGELESLRSQISDSLSKAQFDKQELEVTVETLRTENKQLQKEIAEMSGDGAVAPKGTVAPAHQQPTQQGIQFGEDEDEASSAGAAAPAAIASSSSSGKLAAVAAAAASDAAAEVGCAERNLLLQESLAQLAALASKLGLSSEAATEISGLLRGQAGKYERITSSFESKVMVLERASTEQTRRIRDMEIQRSRVEKDLATRTEKLIKLQFEMDTLRGMDGISAAEYLQERERAQMKSLQQRLEQLVVVHRQLLRKFASLELENGEFRKKITLRDERIKQLEQSSRGLTGNMRQQAERHVAELTNLREQIQLMRSEHLQRMEAREAGGPGAKPGTHHHSDGPRTVRGGTGGAEQPKSLRGGRNSVYAGGQGGHASAPESPDSAPSQAPAAAGKESRSSTGGLFSRLLGK